MRFFKSLTLVGTLFTLFGCVSNQQQLQAGMSELNDHWGSVDSKIYAKDGSRYYRADNKTCMNAAMKAALELGFEVTSSENNLLILRSSYPKPFTAQEAQQIVDVEEPIAQAIVANKVGSTNSNSFHMGKGENNYILLKITTSSEKDGITKVSAIFSGEPKNLPPGGSVAGKYSPPEVVRIGLKKWWDSYEKNFKLKKS